LKQEGVEHQLDPTPITRTVFRVELAFGARPLPRRVRVGILRVVLVDQGLSNIPVDGVPNFSV